MLWRKIRREDDQNVERDLNFTSVMQREEIHAVFERDDPAVEQIARSYLLASKVVNQQDAAIRFDLEGRFVKLMDIIIDEIESFQGQLTTDHDEWTTYFYPAWVTPLTGT